MKDIELQMNADERRWAEITAVIIAAVFAVSNKLGCGFLEQVYQNAMAIELRKRGLKVATKYPMNVHYEGESVGEYIADLVVEDCIIIELKAVKELEDVHKAQCINYLKATGLPICLLVNFGKTRVKVKRFVNLRKTKMARISAFICVYL